MMTEGERSAYFRQREVEQAALEQQLDSLPDDDYRGRFELARQATAGAWRRGSLLSPFEVRHALVQKYAFAVPCDEALDALAALGPIVEMGAGSGYWAYLLRKRGVDIQAYDKHPGTNNHYKFTHRWTGVVHGLPGKLKKRADRALFLCWPNYNSSFASDCLRYYTGNSVAYIGEGGYGCTGDEAFHAALDRDWSEVKEVRLPQWEGIHDALYIYRRQ
jgi:hypothetical protein